MNRFDIALTAEGLTAYAIERQNGWERHQPEGAPPWMERRRFWTDTILQGMARLQGACPDPKLLEQFDCELEQSRRGFAAVPVSLQLQRETIRSLRNFHVWRLPEATEGSRSMWSGNCWRMWPPICHGRARTTALTSLVTRLRARSGI